MQDKLTPAVIARFWERVDRRGPEECWLWLGPERGKGYGGLTYGRTVRLYAHQVSYVLHKGPIPPGLCVCHRCDVRRCCNPDHLWLGTIADNLGDMARKGRSQQGRRHWNVRLFEGDIPVILALRAQGMTYKALGAQFGISPRTVRKITERKIWRHVS